MHHKAAENSQGSDIKTIIFIFKKKTLSFQMNFMALGPKIDGQLPEFLDSVTIGNKSNPSYLLILVKCLEPINICSFGDQNMLYLRNKKRRNM